jgi:3-oxoacyl-[acyl-carrier protein] reductase
MKESGDVEGSGPAASIAIVTGVANPDSIGYATARVLGERGHRLVVVDVSDLVHEAAASLRRAGLDASSHAIDLADAAAVTQLADEVVARFGRIDVLVNNAGLATAGRARDPYEHLAVMSEAKWDFGIAINLKTQFLCCRAVVPHMLAQGWGRIVNMSSTTGPITANRGQPEYCAAKAGVLGLTRGLALEVAARGILVNAVAPGWVDTGGSSPRGLAAGQATPIGRAARPDEIAKLVAFLASADNTYITGQLIAIDGGNSIDEYHGPAEYA